MFEKKGGLPWLLGIPRWLVVIGMAAGGQQRGSGGG